ncbi:MAG: hypothetical protein HY869_06300 [Chloroflexi bacterium]|nr:hypothetical protein [Chloroflexota bacterium]
MSRFTFRSGSSSTGKKSLTMMNAEDRALIQVLNIHTTYVLAVFAILSLVFSNEISDTKLGRMVGMSIAGFWILRAVNEVIFWGTSLTSWIIIFVCLAIAALYIIPSTRKGAIQN